MIAGEGICKETYGFRGRIAMINVYDATTMLRLRRGTEGWKTDEEGRRLPGIQQSSRRSRGYVGGDIFS